MKIHQIACNIITIRIIINRKFLQTRDLSWSRDSDVLSIWYEDIDTGASIVQLWAEKNYHWYLKQTITYPKENPILYFAWSPQTNRDLLILSANCSVAYNFHWSVDHSLGKDLSDKAVVAVIDGDKVLLTGFKDGIVPPPMAQQTLQLDEPVNAIFFAPNDATEDSGINSNDLFCVLHNNKMALFTHENVNNYFIILLHIFVEYTFWYAVL